MLFQVTKPDGTVMMRTDYPECIPFYQLKSLVNSGYILKLNGKKASPAIIEANYKKSKGGLKKHG